MDLLNASPTCHSTPPVGSLRPTSPLGNISWIEVSTSLAVSSRLTTTVGIWSARPYIITGAGHLWCPQFVCYRGLHLTLASLAATACTLPICGLIGLQWTLEQIPNACSSGESRRLAMIPGGPMSPAVVPASKTSRQVQPFASSSSVFVDFFALPITNSLPFRPCQRRQEQCSIQI